MSLTIPHESFNPELLRFVQTNIQNKIKNNVTRICAITSINQPTIVGSNSNGIITSNKPNIQCVKVLYNTPHVTMSGTSILFMYDNCDYKVDLEYIMKNIIMIETNIINKYMNYLKHSKMSNMISLSNINFVSVYSRVYELLSTSRNENKQYIIFRINNIQHNIDSNTVGIVCQVY